MRVISALAALGLLLAGCAGSNQIRTAADAAAVPPGRGVVVFNLERAAELRGTPFTLDIRSVDAAGRIDTARLDRDAPRRASTVLQVEQWLGSPPDTRFAYALEPGDYVLADIGIAQQRTTYYTTTTGSGGGGGAAVGIAALILLGVAAVAIAAADSDTPPERPPLQYVVENVAVSEGPRFQVRPGEVVYIGDILIGAEKRRYRVDDPEWRTGPNKYDTAAEWTIDDTRLFAEYTVDQQQARGYAASLGLGRRPFRTQPVRLSDQARTMFAHYRDPDPKTHVQVGATTLARARPHLPLPADPQTVAGTNPAAPTVPPRAPAALGDLMQDFLDGKINKSEYDAARARLAAGS